MVVTWLLAWPVALAEPLNPESFEPLAQTYTSGEETIDTDAVTFGPYTGVIREGIAIFAFGSLNVDEDLTVIGTRPLALLTTGDLTVRGRINVSAMRRMGGPGGATGPQSGEGNGPGAGESGLSGSGGGHCGLGGAADEGKLEGGMIYGDLLERLTGGSSGASAARSNGGFGGGGGGAIELGALGRLTITGNLLARGGDGQDRTDPGGGGGAGGGILLHGGLGSTCESLVSVIGGMGGDSTDDLAGGGGGGGCITTMGVDVRQCLLRTRGGPAGVDRQGVNKGTSASSGGGAAALNSPDPDYDGDGFRLSDGDCNDLNPRINPNQDPPDLDCDGKPDLPPADTGEVDTSSLETGDPEPAPPPASPAVPRPGYTLCASGGTMPLGGLSLIVLISLWRRRLDSL
ncbi:MAG: hypothetical protein AAGA48_41115 [Myxococcota bacterium]